MTERPSKSARKREFLALQALGEQLVELSDEQLASIPLEENLREAVITARGIRSHGALRRQRQLIGKLMAQAEAEPIREAFEALQQSEQAGKAQFRRAEEWRDRILKEGPAAISSLGESLGETVDDVAAAAREYHSSRNDAGRKRSARKVFRAVHARLQAAAKRGSV